jgi:hypothetical protein
MIFAMPNPRMREANAQARWAAPTRDLPLQDWQGLVPRKSRNEKPANGRVLSTQRFAIVSRNAFIQPQSPPTRPRMKIPPIAFLAGMMLLAACATPTPVAQGDAPPEPVPAGITPLTQELEELAREGAAVPLGEEREPALPSL